MNLADPNHEALCIEKAKSGHTEAFSILVKRYQERVLHTAHSFLGNREEAKDAAQESFVKAYQALKKFKGESKFSTWLYRITANHCKDMLRQRTRRQYEPLESEATEEEKFASPQAGPRQNLISRELGEMIYGHLDQLPDQQRTVFTLRYLEGLHLEEIAEILSLTTGAVKAHLWQAGQKMKKNLAPAFAVKGE